MPSLFGHDIANKTATLIGLLRNIDLQVVFNNVPKKKKGGGEIKYSII